MSLKQNLINLGATSENLDSLVDDAASRIASRTNNEGMSEQLRFLAQAGMSENDILEAVTGALAD